MIDNNVDSVATTGNRKEPGIKRTPNKPHGNKFAIPVSSLFSYSPKIAWHVRSHDIRQERLNMIVKAL